MVFGGQGALVYNGDVKVLLVKWATKFWLQNDLATKFFLQSGGRVMHILFILQNGARTLSVSTKCV